MALDEFMYRLLNSGQRPRSMMPDTANVPPYERVRQDSGAAPSPFGMTQNAPQTLAQTNFAPQAPTQQPAPERAPQGGFGGTFGGFLEALFRPQEAGRRATINWLQEQGMDEGSAYLLASDKPMLRQYLAARMRGTQPQSLMSVGGHIYDPNNNQWISPPQDREAPEAPTVQTFYGDDGQEYKAQWNTGTGQWDRVGGSKAAAASDGMKSEQDLRKEYSARPEFKRFDAVQSAYGRVLTSSQQNTGAGDVSLIFAYMKMLDPGSVVREGEQATAQNTAGVPAQIRNLYNSVASGQRLTPDQRAEFARLAEQLYGDESGNFANFNDQFRGIAGQYGIEPGRVLVQPRQFKRPKSGVVVDGYTIRRVD